MGGNKNDCNKIKAQIKKMSIIWIENKFMIIRNYKNPINFEILKQ